MLTGEAPALHAQCYVFPLEACETKTSSPPAHRRFVDFMLNLRYGWLLSAFGFVGLVRFFYVLSGSESGSEWFGVGAWIVSATDSNCTCAQEEP